MDSARYPPRSEGHDSISLGTGPLASAAFVRPPSSRGGGGGALASAGGVTLERRLMEGDEDDADIYAEDDRERERAFASQYQLQQPSDWGSLNAPLSTEEAIRKHQRRLQYDVDKHYPLSNTPSSNSLHSYARGSGGASHLSDDDQEEQNALCSSLSPRAKLALTVSFGSSLIIAVMVVFIVLLNQSLMDARHDRLERNVVHMQLLGQSVLRYDIRRDQSNSSDYQQAMAWMEQWALQLNRSDFVLSDLETSITGPEGGVDWRDDQYSHIAPPSTLDVLGQLGLNVWVCSNNHAWDLGVQGMYDLFDALSARNLSCAGVGQDLASASKAVEYLDRGLVSPTIYNGPNNTDPVPGQFNRKNIRLALVAMASGAVNASAIAGPQGPPGVNVLRLDVAGDGTLVLDADDLARQQAAVNAAVASPSNDLVGVYEHDHYALVNQSADPSSVDAWRVSLAHGFVDSGASFYFSHGSPYVQGIEIYRGAPIFYGLGNFIFQSRATSGRWDPGAYEGVVVDAEWGCVACGGSSLPVSAAVGVAARLWSNLFGAGAAAEAGQPAASTARPSTHHRTRSFGAQTPSPSSPSSSSACRCGFKLTGLVLRPLVMLMPSDPPFPGMSFNHSWGLPTLSMPRAKAVSVLQRVADLSRAFGTVMDIINTYNGFDPHPEEMQSQVYAAVHI